MSLEDIRQRLLRLLPPGSYEVIQSICFETAILPLGTNSELFRLKHRQYKDLLAKLVAIGLVSDEYDSYQEIYVYHLHRVLMPILEADKIKVLLEYMNKLLPFLVAEYEVKASHHISLGTMVNYLGGNRNIAREAILCLENVGGFTSFGDASIESDGNQEFLVSEDILDVGSLDGIFDRELRELEGRSGRVVEESSDDRDPELDADLDSLFENVDFHPQVISVAGNLLKDGHHWDAVFAASKALIKMVKEKSGRSDLDGAPLMRAVFSPNKPILKFKNSTMRDEQEGLMHLFEGAVLAIRNPGGHDFPDGTPRRALDYLSLLSLLMSLIDEAEKV